MNSITKLLEAVNNELTKILNKVSRSTYKLLPICKWKIVHMSSNHSIDEPFTKRGEVALLPLLFLWSVHLYYTFFVKFDNLLFLKRIFEMLQNLTCFWIQKNCDVFSFCASFIFSLQWMPWAQVLQAHIHTHTHTHTIESSFTLQKYRICAFNTVIIARMHAHTLAHSRIFPQSSVC